MADRKFDPLLHDLELPYERVFFPFGFALRLRTNAISVLDAAAQSWAAFPQQSREPAVELQVGIEDVPGAVCPPPPIYRSRRNLLTFTADAANFGVCDSNAGFALCWLTSAAMSDPGYVRFYFLEALGYSMVTLRHLAPIHGACVARDGRGVVLCGPSGAGKSSLAYACARQGWTYISDDATHLVRGDPSLTAIGNPYRIRFRPSAQPLFPELFEYPARIDLSGKPTMEIATRDLGLECEGCARVDALLFLDRHAGASPEFPPLQPHEALERLEEAVYYGADSIREEQRAAYRALVGRVAVRRFRYDNLDAATGALERFVARELS